MNSELLTKKITVLGAGSFGSVIANQLATNGHDVYMWLRSKEQCKELNKHRINKKYLPGLTLHSNITITNDIASSVYGAEIIFISIPSKSFREISQKIAPWLTTKQSLVSTTKGIETTTFTRMSEILKQETKIDNVAVLSGPNLAVEMSKGVLTASVIASENKSLRENIQSILSSKVLRVYDNADMFGVELAGALKNIYAIIAGLSHTLLKRQPSHDNTNSLLITRSLAEMSRFASALGANPLTFMGMAGVGDLIVTCLSPLSRNFRLGTLLGEKRSLAQALIEINGTVEGINTTKAVREKSEEMNIYMPLLGGLYQIMFENVAPFDIADELMMGNYTHDVDF